jgi:hypothetical protein
MSGLNRKPDVRTVLSVVIFPNRTALVTVNLRREAAASKISKMQPRSQCLASAHPLLRRDPGMVWSRES